MAGQARDMFNHSTQKIKKLLASDRESKVICPRSAQLLQFNTPKMPGVAFTITFVHLLFIALLFKVYCINFQDILISD